nr:zinc finger MYM-type protein 1-like [Tanacetum cinerariifolium]
RHFGGFPGDLSLGIGFPDDLSPGKRRWGRLVRDSFPGDNPRRKVSTATAERGFSAMKICKTRLRNRMSDDFLADSLVVYIEKEVAENFDSDSIIDEFKKLKGRRANL